MARKARRIVTDWQTFALDFARNVYPHFKSRRGLLYVENLDVLVLYGKASARDKKSQDEETAEFRRRLATEGIGELAYATWPPPGHEDAITPEGGASADALVINAGRDRGQWVAKTMLDIARATSDRLNWVLDHKLDILREVLKRSLGESPN
jgi:hypothetical protein